MTLQIPDRSDETTALETKDFTMKASKEAFILLSNGLYSDPIKAIVRELSCNAYDAHISASKAGLISANKKFDIHLPVGLNDYHFIIRDYGKGLSHEDVMNLYTTYFESTKLNDDDQIGSLGLGSKSPLGYNTSNFKVTSIYEGILRSYNVFLNKEGMPTIHYLGENPTSEESGLCIDIACTYSDVDEWQSAARDVFKYFDKIPNILNLKNKRIPSIYKSKLYSLKNVAVMKRNVYNSKWRVVQGNIAYPIDFSQLPSSLLIFRDTMSGIIRAKNNSVEFSPSRESLKYTKKTKEFLISELRKAYNHNIKKIESRINRAKTYEEIKFLFCEYKNDTGTFTKDLLDSTKDSYLLKVLKDKVQHLFKKDFKITSNRIAIAYSGQKDNYNVTNDIKLGTELILNNTLIKYDVMFSGENNYTVYNVKPTSNSKYGHVIENLHVSLTNLKERSMIFEKYTDKVFFIINDRKKQNVSAIKNFIRGDWGTRYSDSIVVYFKNRISNKHLKKLKMLKEIFGKYVQIEFTSNLKLPEKKKATTTKIKKTTPVKINHGKAFVVQCHKYNAKWGDSSYIEDLLKYNGKKYWFTRKGFNALDLEFNNVSSLDNDHYIRYSDPKRFLQRLKNVTGIGTIYGIKEADVHLVENDKNMIHIPSNLYDILDKCSDEEMYKTYYLNSCLHVVKDLFKYFDCGAVKNSYIKKLYELQKNIEDYDERKIKLFISNSHYNGNILGNAFKESISEIKSMIESEITENIDNLIAQVPGLAVILDKLDNTYNIEKLNNKISVDIQNFINKA